MFSISLTIFKQPKSWKTNEEVANWVSNQLKLNGFNTIPVGASWGMWCPGRDKREENKQNAKTED